MVSSALIYSSAMVIIVAITVAGVVAMNRELYRHKRWRIREQHQHEAVSVAESERAAQTAGADAERVEQDAVES